MHHKHSTPDGRAAEEQPPAALLTGAAVGTPLAVHCERRPAQPYDSDALACSSAGSSPVAHTSAARELPGVSAAAFCAEAAEQAAATSVSPTRPAPDPEAAAPALCAALAAVPCPTADGAGLPPPTSLMRPVLPGVQPPAPPPPLEWLLPADAALWGQAAPSCTAPAQAGTVAASGQERQPPRQSLPRAALPHPLPPASQVVCPATLADLVRLPPRNISLDSEEGGSGQVRAGGQGGARGRGGGGGGGLTAGSCGAPAPPPSLPPSPLATAPPPAMGTLRPSSLHSPAGHSLCPCSYPCSSSLPPAFNPRP
jgi:hypothetical protein